MAIPLNINFYNNNGDTSLTDSVIELNLLSSLDTGYIRENRLQGVWPRTFLFGMIVSLIYKQPWILVPFFLSAVSNEESRFSSFKYFVLYLE